MIDCIEESEGYVIPLEHLKNHLRLESSAEDNYLESIIKTATAAVENYVERTLLVKTWRILSHHLRKKETMHNVELYYPPLLHIVSVSEILSKEEKKSLKRYSVALNGSRPFLSVLAENVEIIYKAGYGEAGSSIPLPIRQAITLVAAEMYDKRVDTCI